MKTLELYGMRNDGYYCFDLSDKDRQALEFDHDLKLESAVYGLAPAFRFYSDLEDPDAIASQIIDSLHLIHDYFVCQGDFAFTYDNNLSPEHRTLIKVHFGLDSITADVGFAEDMDPSLFVSDMLNISKQIERRAHHMFNLDIHVSSSVPVFAMFTFLSSLELWLFFQTLSSTDMDFQIIFD